MSVIANLSAYSSDAGVENPQPLEDVYHFLNKLKMMFSAELLAPRPDLVQF